MGFNIDDLLKKPPNEKWTSCFVPVDQFKADGWAQIEHVPRVHVVGKTPDGQFYQVAVCASCIRWLLDHDFPFELASAQGLQHDISEPGEGEIRVQGIREARRRAQSCFVRNAIRGIWSGRGRGLDRYYRYITVNQDVLVPIEWAIVIRDIVVCFHDWDLKGAY